MPQTIAQLQDENQQLKFQLAETQSQLHEVLKISNSPIYRRAAPENDINSNLISEIIYSNFIEEMNDATVLVSSDGQIIYCNKRFIELTKNSPTLLTGSNFCKFLHTQDVPVFNLLLKSQFDGKYFINLPYGFSGQNENHFQPFLNHASEIISGTVCLLLYDIKMPVEIEGTLPSLNLSLHLPLTDFGGSNSSSNNSFPDFSSIIRIMSESKNELQNIIDALIIEMNDRKKIENDLKDSEEFIKRIISSSRDCIKILDLDGNLLSMNEGGQETMEISNISCYLNSPWIDFWEDLEKKVIKDAFERAKNGEIAKFSGYCKTGKGNLKWWDVVITPILDTDGHIHRILSISRDMTEQKNAQEAIMKAIERYEILAKATSDTIWDCDLLNHTMLYNDGITNVFGYKTKQLNNQSDWWEQHIHPDDLQNVTTNINSVFAKKNKKIHLNYRFRCSDGSYKYILDRAFVFYNESGTPYRMIGAMQDITFQKEEDIIIAKQIINAQETERCNIGMELHDNVNQILIGSLISLDMGIAKMADKNKALEFLEKTKVYINLALDEIRKLSHKLTPDANENISLKKSVDEMLVRIKGNNNHDISLDFSDLTKINLSYDLEKNLFRIIQEQCKNILKYAKATKISISAKITGNFVKLRILDNGVGFDATFLKTEGIGLSNIKRRAEAFLGKYSIQSSIGKGCEIIVEIPIGITTS